MEIIKSDVLSNGAKLNPQQKNALKALIDFSTVKNENDVFILAGSAGTGKTRLLKNFTEELEKRKIDFKLLAPTGRATQVLAKRTKRSARTMHSFIYSINEIERNTIIRYEFVPKLNNLTSPCIFIVDEASMISDIPANNELFLSQHSVLHDLIQFYRKSPEGSKIVFVGDSFQLPPVNEDFSVALSKKHLEENHNVKATGFSLTEIVRQTTDSYILRNVMQLRDLMIKQVQYFPKLRYKEMYRTELAISTFCKLYNPNDAGQVIFLGWRNATIDKLNTAIRNKLFNQPSEILLPMERIIVGHSYYSNNLFIASGDIGRVISFYPNTYERVGDTVFADAIFEFHLNDGEKVKAKCKFNVDYLLRKQSDNKPEKISKLWANRKRNNKIFRETNNPADDPYLSAIKVRYAYAITTHKAQGGEWDNVFIYPEYPKDNNRLKWTYTTITRASKELYSF